MSIKKLNKLMLIGFVMTTILVACGKNEVNTSKIDVPQNKEEKKTKEINENKDTSNDVENEIANPDLTGGISEVTSTGILVNIANDEGVNDEGESIVGTNKDDDKKSVEFTEKTEFKKLIVKNKTGGRLEKGSKSDVATNRGVLLYGSYVGDKFIATKVIIMYNEQFTHR